MLAQEVENFDENYVSTLRKFSDIDEFSHYVPMDIQAGDFLRSRIVQMASYNDVREYFDLERKTYLNTKFKLELKSLFKVLFFCQAFVHKALAPKISTNFDDIDTL